jgi:hypothetical protein
MTPVRLLFAAAFFLGLPFASRADGTSPADGVKKVDLVFEGGHDTDPRDHGRPVVLIAAALGVPAPVFRDAFSHVHPARPGGPPQEDQVRQNKQALMERLSPYGVTDDRLNEVSNYYRYRSWAGELWRHVAAAAYALVKGDKIVDIVLTQRGAGYTTPPRVSVRGVGLTVYPMATLAYGKDLATNGSIKAVVMSPLGENENIRSGSNLPEHKSVILKGSLQEIGPVPPDQNGNSGPPPPPPPQQ